MNDYHRENMRKHIAFLENNASNIRLSFNMQFFQHVCGTPSCSLGYAELSTSIERKSATWKEYAVEVFGIDSDSDLKTYAYAFGGGWTDINNTPEAAAARMKAILYNQIPEEFNKWSPHSPEGYTAAAGHPIVIIPEEFKEEAKKLFVKV